MTDTLTTQDAKGLCDSALESLIETVAKGNSDRLRVFLDTLAKFHRYSFHNWMLIWLQRPDASRVAGFNAWKEMGRYVRKGEKGIRILAPRFKAKKDAKAKEEPADDANATAKPAEREIVGFITVSVFDVAQTDGEPLADIGGIEGDPGTAMARLESAVRSAGIAITEQRLADGHYGTSHKGAITLAEGMDGNQRFSVLAHEYAHELLHATDGEKRLSTTVKEVEAESVAYVVCKAFGVNTQDRTADYIRLYAGDPDHIRESFQRIHTTATRIIKEMQPAD